MCCGGNKSVTGVGSKDAEQDQVIASLTTNLSVSRPYCRYQFVIGQISGTPISLIGAVGRMYETNPIGDLPLYQVPDYGWNAEGDPTKQYIFSVSYTLRLAPGQPSPAPWAVNFQQAVQTSGGTTVQNLATSQTSTIGSVTQFLNNSSLVICRGGTPPALTGTYFGFLPSPIDITINPTFNMSFVDVTLLGVY